jgi:1-acyl-sn-glycerol-3-phosphate acyltransferase
MQVIRSAVIWVAVIGLTLLVSVGGLLVGLLPGGRRVSQKMIRGWGRNTLRIAGVSYRTVGLESIDLEGPCIFVANHQSTLDIPICIATLPGRVRMLGKHSLFRIPVFGWLLHREGFVPVNRKAKAKARLSLGAAERSLKRGARVFVFPEGTRTRTGELNLFKTGAFRLALATGVPIIPVTIIGARRILPAKHMLLNRGEIVLVAGEPIVTEGREASDRHQIRNRAREWIATTKESYEAELFPSSSSPA